MQTTTTTAPRPTLYYGWVIALSLGITATISYGVLFYAFSVFIAPIEAELGWTRGETTGAFSLALLLNGIAAVAVGIWVDRHGARVLMTLGALFSALLMFALAFVQSLPQFYLIWFGIGLTMAMTFYEPGFTVIANWFRKYRGRALAVITFIAGFSSTIFLPLTDWLVRNYGWRGAVIILAGLLVFIVMPMHALILRRKPEDSGLFVDGEASVLTEAAVSVESISLKGALRSRSFWWLTAGFGFVSIGATALRIHFIPYLLDLGFTSEFAAYAAGLIGAMQVLGRVIYVPLQTRFATRVMTAAVFGLQAVTMAVLLLAAGSSGGVLAGVVIFGAAQGALTLLRPALLAEMYGTAYYGRISSMMGLVLIGVVTLAPAGAGVLYERTQSYTSVLVVLLMASVLAVLTMMFMPRGKPGVQG
ncbi:MAG: MFS transporter [Anaerolineae bacterium]